jgi:hypothetical protein
MDRCTRFEHEGALRLEAGAAPDEHEQGCADCGSARRDHLRIAAAMRLLPAVTLPDGWADGVRARIAPPAPASSWWRWAGMAGGLAAAAVVVLLARCTGGDARLASNDVPVIEQEVRATAPDRRAGSAVIGDTLVVRASARPAHTRELRVYQGARGNGAKLVARCSASERSEGCAIVGDGLELTTRLGEPGVYRFPRRRRPRRRGGGRHRRGERDDRGRLTERLAPQRGRTLESAGTKATLGRVSGGGGGGGGSSFPKVTPPSTAAWYGVSRLAQPAVSMTWLAKTTSNTFPPTTEKLPVPSELKVRSEYFLALPELRMATCFQVVLLTLNVMVLFEGLFL